MGPLLDALRELGGAGTPKSVQERIQLSLKLPADILEEKNKSGQPKFYNQLHWARKYLVWEGLLDGQTYVTSPEKELVALCEITKGLHKTKNGEVIEFKKIEHFKEPVTLAELQSGPELANCEPVLSHQGSLFALKEEEYEFIRALIDERNLGTKLTDPASFTKTDALDGLFMSESQLDSILARLKRKKALILQGPPGVGKTFVARRLAFALMEQKDQRRVSVVQFHPSYGYEDFIQGFRPSRSGGLERRDGVFYEFARLARNDPGRDWFFIIDEINRGNLAKIFGELLMLLEADKRGPDHQVSLTYSEKDERFYLPQNLHVIGTMNTADRSLAMVDYALRRRFAFETLKPALESPAFGQWIVKKGADQALLDKIRVRIGNLNATIDKERDLGERFRVGHSFFCPGPNDKPDHDWYREIILSEIKPLLEEYFDSAERVNSLVEDLLK
jgi:5-methylcytosine-specific restriction enzyme B